MLVCKFEINWSTNKNLRTLTTYLRRTDAQHFHIPHSTLWGRGTIIYISYILIFQSMPITTKVVSSNPPHGEVYSMQHYVIKLINSGFFHQLNWPPGYNWNIVDSGIKHHNPKPLLLMNMSMYDMYIIVPRPHKVEWGIWKCWASVRLRYVVSVLRFLFVDQLNKSTVYVYMIHFFEFWGRSSKNQRYVHYFILNSTILFCYISWQMQQPQTFFYIRRNSCNESCQRFPFLSILGHVRHI
jgi:hypothetical protein